jgi:hypothetical protein
MNYMCVSRNPRTIELVDTTTGGIKHSINVGGTIVQGPVVTGDTVSVTIRSDNNSNFVNIYNLAGLSLRNTIAL